MCLFFTYYYFYWEQSKSFVLWKKKCICIHFCYTYLKNKQTNKLGLILQSQDLYRSFKIDIKFGSGMHVSLHFIEKCHSHWLKGRGGMKIWKVHNVHLAEAVSWVNLNVNKSTPYGIIHHHLFGWTFKKSKMLRKE